MLPSGFTFIERGWFNCNQIVLHGRAGPVLVDSGHLLCVDETLAKLTAHGVDPASLVKIVTTHGHADHHGANATLKALSGAPLAMGPTTAVWFAQNNGRMLWMDHLGQEMALVPADEIIEPNRTIMLADMPFQVLSAPGHAPDSLAFYQPDTKVLIAADALWEGDVGVLNTAVHGWSVIDEALETLARFAQLDIAVAIPGHGGLITNVAENIAQVQRRVSRFKENPAALANHIVRRFLMFVILRYQPVARDELTALALTGPWLSDYAPLCGADTAVGLLNTLLDSFLERGVLATDEEGLLIGTIPR